MRALPLQLGALLAGKYRIDAVLGTGGMGTVFAAENIDLGRAVAIKVLHDELAHDPDLARRLRQEARSAATIGHPGIVDVLDLGTTESGAPFIVMERLEGESLGARLANRASLTPAIAIGIMQKAIEALAAAHAKGIIHRDLKPDNIFLTVHPQAGVKLVDFGISKQVTNDLTVTTTGVVMGTPLYMSPEQARGARDVTTATDLYSIGVILYQALSGTPPHVAHNYNEMLAMILQQEPLPLATLVPELPRELTDLVHELLSKYVDVRPTALETANRLRVIARLLDTSTVAFSPTLQPDNVSDDELGHTFAAAPVGEPTLPPTPSPPLPFGETLASIPPRPSLPLGETLATVPPSPPLPLGGTLASVPSSPSLPVGGTLASIHPSLPLGGTLASIPPSPPLPVGETLASIPPGPQATPRPAASAVTANEPATPTAEISAPTPPRRGVLAILGALALVLSVVLIVVIMRSSGGRVTSDAFEMLDASKVVAGDAAPLLDAAFVAVDAASSVDTGVAVHDGQDRRDAGQTEPPRDAGQDRRDAGQLEPRRDAGVFRRDAGATPDAGSMAPPDAAPPDAAAAGSNELDIDETNPLKR